MATTAIPTFQAISGVEGEPQFVVSYPHGGVIYVVGFDSFMDLLNIVASYKDRFNRPLPSDLINMIVDFAEESMEWNDQQHTYPLGVTYVGEAVCDFAPPDYDPQTVAFDQTDRHRELIEELRRTNDRLWFRSEGFKVMLGVSFAVIALLIWRGW